MKPQRKTLVVLIGQDRELSRTHPSLERNLLTPFQADLAFFGSKAETEPNFSFDYDWTQPEPEDWFQEIVNTGLNPRDIEAYQELHPQFFSGVGNTGYRGNGAIVHYWRYKLGKFLLPKLRELPHEWFVITRSDFLWTTPFPPIKNFAPERVYFLDGEHYSGVEDRFILFHKNWAENVLGVCTDLFERPEKSLGRLQNLDFLNAEVFLHSEWSRNGVMEKARFIPYLGFLIRTPSTSTNRPNGVFDSCEGVFVKYPSEKRQATHYSRFIRRSEQWGEFPRRRPRAEALAAFTTWGLRRLGQEISRWSYPARRRWKTRIHRFLRALARFAHPIR